jgi:hypothetical protein
VLVRLPNEQPTDDFRYFIVNGVGRATISPHSTATWCARSIGTCAGTGQAT